MKDEEKEPSVLLHFKMPLEQALLLKKKVEEGALKEFGVKSVDIVEFDYDDEDEECNS